MRFDRANLSFLVLFLLVGAILCSALGTLIVTLIPSLDIIPGDLIGPVEFDRGFIGFKLTINLSTIIGLILGFIVFRKV